MGTSENPGGWSAGFGGKTSGKGRVRTPESVIGLQSEYAQFLRNLLSGNPTGASVPIIAKGQEASRMATSDTLRSLDEMLSRTHLAGTPYGERTRADTMLMGELATSRVPTDIMSQFLSNAPAISGQATQSEIARGQIESAAYQAQLQAFSNLWGGIIGAAGKAAAA